MWIKEKVSTTNSKYRKRKSDNKIFVTPTDESRIHARNAEGMGHADRLQTLQVNGTDVSPISNALNLISDSHPVTLSWKKQDNIRVVNFPQTLTAAADSLPKGKSVCFEILIKRPGLETAGHAVSIYRSRGGTLHFFDPNAGAYEVRDVQQFMEAWVTGCGNRGWSVSPYFRESRDDDDHSWYHVYTRHQ